MRIYEKINRQGICPRRTESGEFAWQIKDHLLLLELFYDRKCVVLGGDVLDSDRNYTYDSWYYNDNTKISHGDNVKDSISIAKDYLSNYIKSNGENYYVVFVFR